MWPAGHMGMGPEAYFRHSGDTLTTCHVQVKGDGAAGDSTSANANLICAMMNDVGSVLPTNVANFRRIKLSVLEKYTHSIRLLTSMPDWENNKFKSSGKSFQAAIARPDQLAPDHVLTRSSHPLPHPESSSTSSRSFSSQDLRSLIDIFGKAAPVGLAPGRRLFLRACAGTAATSVLKTFTVDNFSCRDVASSVIVPQESGHSFIFCFLQCPDTECGF